MSNFIHESILFLYEYGFFTIILPFILIYTILFALMQKVQIFGKGNYANYNAVFSFAVAFFTVYNIDIAEGLPILFARIGLLFIFILIIQIVSGFLEMQHYLSHEKARPITFTFITIYLLYSVMDAFFDYNIILKWITRYIDLTIFSSAGLSIVVFIGIMWFILHEKKTPSSTENNVSENNASEEKPRPEDEPMKMVQPHPDNISYNSKGYKSIDEAGMDNYEE